MFGFTFARTPASIDANEDMDCLREMLGDLLAGDIALDRDRMLVFPYLPENEAAVKAILADFEG